MRAKCAAVVPLVLLFFLVCTTSIAQSSEAQSSAAQVAEPQFARTTVSLSGAYSGFLSVGGDTWARITYATDRRPRLTLR